MIMIVRVIRVFRGHIKVNKNLKFKEVETLRGKRLYLLYRIEYPWFQQTQRSKYSSGLISITKTLTSLRRNTYYFF
jgi:hypothetical protein